MKEIKHYESSCELIATTFVKKYWGKADTYWVADDVGGVLVVNEDYFYDIGDMVDYLKYRYTKEQMFKRYDQALGHALKGKDGFPNIKNWKKLK